MSGIVESATAILALSEKKLERVSSNISNVNSSGFKKQISFLETMDHNPIGFKVYSSNRPDVSQGKLIQTNNPLDLSISGSAFFLVRSGDKLILTRQGHFQLSESGLVVTPQGYALQQLGGGDLVLDHVAVKILEDGTVLDRGQPVGRIALLAPSDVSLITSLGGSFFSAPEGLMTEAQDSVVRQGMVESSNVVLGEEMVTMMSAIREAETGARIIQTYDDLMGRAISTIGQAGR